MRDAGVRVHEPTGGFYLFLDFSNYTEKLNARGIHTSVELCNALLDETGVAILHGHSFSRDENEMTARMAYVDFDGARALTFTKSYPVERPLDNDFYSFYCARVVEGVTVMAQWLKNL